MQQQTMAARAASSPVWAELESLMRERVQAWVQQLLDEELTEALGRRKSERRTSNRPGYRNGYGKPRKLTMSSGTITVHRPRARGLGERFESRLLPLFGRRTREVNDLLPRLYLHGLAEGDFTLALRGLLGEDAPLSAATIARLKDQWHQEWTAWQQRSLADLEVVYLWVDGVYVRAGLERDKAAVLVAIAGLTDGRKVLVTVTHGYRESTVVWSDVLRDLRDRGMNCPAAVVGDGHLGIWGALRNVYPEAEEARCWNHKIMNVLAKVPKGTQLAVTEMVRRIPQAPTSEEAERRKDEFAAWCQQRGYPGAIATLERDWEQLVTFYRFPKEHWKHLRTSNPVESPFAALRLRTDAAKRYKRADRATPMVWKLLMISEKKFRRLNAPHLLPDVYRGERFVNGLRAADTMKDMEEAAA